MTTSVRDSTSVATSTVVTIVAARAAAVEWLRYGLVFMVILLGSMFDPGVMLGGLAGPLCQGGDTAREKVGAPEKPHNGGLSRPGRQP